MKRDSGFLMYQLIYSAGRALLTKQTKKNKKTKVNVLCYAESIDNHAEEVVPV